MIQVISLVRNQTPPMTPIGIKRRTIRKNGQAINLIAAMHIFKKGSLIRQLQIHFNNMTSKLQKECGGTAGAKKLVTTQLVEVV